MKKIHLLKFLRRFHEAGGDTLKIGYINPEGGLRVISDFEGNIPTITDTKGRMIKVSTHFLNREYLIHPEISRIPRDGMPAVRIVLEW